MAVYIYESKNGDAWKNLAIDKYFLENLNEDDILLYFYVNHNAVIIGKNQNAWKECALDAMEQDDVQLVRRHTGGGAVFHDNGNLNFSFIMHERIYDQARQAAVIMRALEKFGIHTELSGRNDILANGRKFSGNAFGVYHCMRSHHGTLLIDADLNRLSKYLQVSPKKIQSKGIDSVRSRVCNLKELQPEITVEKVKETLAFEFEQEYGKAQVFVFPPSADEKVDKLYQEQVSWEWRLGKAPKFDYQIEERLSFGEIQLLCSLQHGIIKEIQVYSDALDIQLAEHVQQALKGIRFEVKAMSEALTVSTDDPKLQELAEYIKGLIL